MGDLLPQASFVEDLVLWHGLLSAFYVLRTFIQPAGTLTVTYEHRSSNP